MPAEGKEWIMRGMNWDDPYRIRTPEALVDYVKQVGFLPLFANEVPGFSAEEHVSPLFWWTGDPEQDPWEWRVLIARSGLVAYGKFFDKKAGFISPEWLPAFANHRRDGYDFDSRWEDGMARSRSKKLMDLFEEKDELMGFEMKRMAGFGKDGEKNFSGIVTELQMQTYLTACDFRCRTRKDGTPYGWPVTVYTTPEQLFGVSLVRSGYREDPKASFERMVARVREEYPWADEKAIRKLLK